MIENNKQLYEEKNSTYFIEEVKQKMEFYTHYFENESAQAHIVREVTLPKSLLSSMNVI